MKKQHPRLQSVMASLVTAGRYKAACRVRDWMTKHGYQVTKIGHDTGIDHEEEAFIRELFEEFQRERLKGTI